MKKNLIVPVVLLATTPFVVACTKKPTDTPPPPAVTGVTETVTPPPAVTPVEVTLQSGSSGSVEVTPPTVPPQATTTSGIISRTEVLSYDSRSPEGMVPVEFSVTVTDGIITAASATPKTDKQASNYNQTNFAKALPGAVVGKKAKDLDVDAIGGASLTTGAFEIFVRSF